MFYSDVNKEIEKCISLKLTPFLSQMFRWVIAGDGKQERWGEHFPGAQSRWEVLPPSNTLITLNPAYFHILCAYIRILITVPQTSLQHLESSVLLSKCRAGDGIRYRWQLSKEEFTEMHACEGLRSWDSMPRGLSFYASSVWYSLTHSTENTNDITSVSKSVYSHHPYISRNGFCINFPYSVVP